jgi:putative membrane protein
MKPSEWIDAAGKQRLEECVARVERDTEGEIVLLVVHACDEYGSVGWRFGVVLAALAYLGAVLIAPSWNFWVYLLVQAGALGLGHLLARFEPLRRRLLPSALMEERLHQRARRAFSEQGLERTRGRTGVLILVATLERRVVVLGDSGINAVLDPDESWQQVIDEAVAGLRAGRPVEGLEAAVERCGAMLRRHVPTVHPRVDQLPNAVVLED